MMKGYDLYQKLHLNISPNDLDKVLYHASYQPQDNNIKKMNKELIVYGHSVTKVILAIYAYTNKIYVSASDISKMVNSSYNYILDAIYNEYELEKYQYLSRGEEGKEHKEVAAKIVAVFYGQNGFKKTYDFLLRYMKHAFKSDSYDYKTVLQEYAQAKKIPVSYEIINTEGPDNNLTFTCQLTVGTKKCLANGRSKKAAMKSAAQVYIRQNNIPIKAKISNKEKTIDEHIRITTDRKKCLYRQLSTLHINANDLPIEYVNAAFVHKSIQHEKKNLYADNSALSVIGAEILQVFIVDYLYETSDWEYLLVTREKGSYLNAKNLYKVLPDEWLRILLASKSIEFINEEGLGSLKIDIFHSIVAVLVIRGIKTNNYELEEKASNIAFHFFDIVKECRIPDYITALQEVVQAHGMQYKKICENNLDRLDNIPIYNAKVTCWNDEIYIEKYGEGTNQKKAIGVAAKEVLDELLPYFEDNFKIKKIILRVLYPEEYLQLLKDTWKIKKRICLLSGEGEKKKWFATVQNATNKNAYDISLWENENKKGIVFSADEIRQLSRIFDEIAPFPDVEEVTEAPQPTDFIEVELDPVVKEVIEGKENTLSEKLTKEQKLEIIRAELIAGNNFNGYEGNYDKLLPHQKAACRIAEMFDKFAFFYDTGTGKTVLALDIITSKAEQNGTSFLIICPKSIILTAWMEDQCNFYPEMKLDPLSQNITLRQYLDINRRWNSIDGRSVFNDYLYYEDWQSGSKANQLKYVRSVMIGKAKHYIVNPESFIRNISFYKSLSVDGLIIDESSILKNYSSKISKCVREFADDCKYVYLLSGKPAPNNTMEYFSQMKVVAPDDFPMTYEAYKNKYYINVNNRIVCKSAEAEKEVSDIIGKHSIVVSKYDCLKLPDTVHMVRKITLDKDVMKKYETMYRDYFINIEQQELESKNRKTIYNVNNKLASLMKLRQLVSGFLLDADGKVTQIHKRREEELLRVLDEIGDEQVIIWCQFKYEIQNLKRLLEKIGKKVVTAYSGTKDKDESIRMFKEGIADVILAHPKTLQYGVTFVNCKYAIYYSLSYSFEEYYQSHDRIYRYGQKNICSFIFLQAEDTIDEVLYECVRNKKEDAEIFELLIKDASEHNIFVD